MSFKDIFKKSKRKPKFIFSQIKKAHFSVIEIVQNFLNDHNIKMVLYF